MRPYHEPFPTSLVVVLLHTAEMCFKHDWDNKSITANMFSMKPDVSHGQDSVIALGVTVPAWASPLANALKKS